MIDILYYITNRREVLYWPKRFWDVFFLFYLHFHYILDSHLQNASSIYSLWSVLSFSSVPFYHLAMLSISQACHYSKDMDLWFKPILTTNFQFRLWEVITCSDSSKSSFLTANQHIPHPIPVILFSLPQNAIKTFRGLLKSKVVPLWMLPKSIHW